MNEHNPHLHHLPYRSYTNDQTTPNRKITSIITARMRLLIFFCLLILCQPVLSKQICPDRCKCNWISGKVTASCENAQLISIPTGFESTIQVLHLEDNNLQVLPSQVFQNSSLTNLQRLFLARSKLGQIRADALQKLTGLIELDLSDNLLTSVPSDAFVQANAVRRLHLNGNPLRRIRSGAFAALRKLVFLNLSNTQLESLEPGAFAGIEKLNYLTLSNNHLSTLGERVFNDLNSLYSLLLNDNPWVCDCELRPAHLWISQKNVHIGTKPTCAAPTALAGRDWDTLSSSQFACVPHILPSDTRILAREGTTALLQCLVRAMNESLLHWRVQLNNGSWLLVDSSSLNSGTAVGFPVSQEADQLIGRLQLHPPHVSEEDEQVIVGRLQLRNVSSSDAGRRFMCSATNEAGSASFNYTLDGLSGGVNDAAAAAVSVVASSSGLFWIFLLIILIVCVIATNAFIASKRILCFAGRNDQSDQDASPNKSALPSLDVLKHVGAAGKPGSGGHLGNALLNGNFDKRSNTLHGKPVIENASSSGYGSNGVTPDLTSCVLKMQHSASYAQLASNGGYAGCPPTELVSHPVDYSGYTSNYAQHQQQLMNASMDAYGYLPSASNPNDFGQYLQPIEATGGAYGLYSQPVSGVGAVANYENMYEGCSNIGDSQHVYNYGTEAYGGIENQPMYWSTGGASGGVKPAEQMPLSVASSSHVNVLPPQQPNYLAAQPTVVRYSPG